MIGLLSKVNIIDNSGGLEGRCIKVLNPKSTKSGRKQRTAQTGDLILISLTKSLPVSHSTKYNISAPLGALRAASRSPAGSGNIYKALIVRTKKESNKFIKNINNNSSSVSPAATAKTVAHSSNSNNATGNVNVKSLGMGASRQWKYKNSRLSFNGHKSNPDIKIIQELSLKMDTVKNSYDDNSVVLVKVNPNSLDYTPLGTRIKGPICKKLKNRKGCTKIVSILT